MTCFMQKGNNCYYKYIEGVMALIWMWIGSFKYFMVLWLYAKKRVVVCWILLFKMYMDLTTTAMLKVYKWFKKNVKSNGVLNQFGSYFSIR